MADHYQLSDEEFEAQFESLQLEPTLFNHEAHLRLAWIHISKYGIETAIDNMCSQIRKFAGHHGDHDKFNTTVTVAATQAVYHFMNRSQSTGFKDFIAEFPRLKTSFKKLIDAHYSVDIFKSEIAKKEYIEPDKIKFDK